MTIKQTIIYLVTLIIIMIYVLIGRNVDSACETFLGISALISGWIGIIMCGFMLLYCINGGSDKWD